MQAERWTAHSRQGCFGGWLTSVEHVGRESFARYGMRGRESLSRGCAHSTHARTQRRADGETGSKVKRMEEANTSEERSTMMVAE